MNQPIRIHPDNPKLFEFRDRPLVLVCATEHYGAVINRDFDFESYLQDAADKSQTLTRLFMLFRELQTPINPYSTCKPESTEFVCPYPRTGPELAMDGLPRFDLSQWNDEFFERLHQFISSASEHGIVVEVVLLSNTYLESLWELNPFHPSNNINELPELDWTKYNTLLHPELFKYQSALVKKVVEELNPYDNVFFEICNEPGSFEDLTKVDEWQEEIYRQIREIEKSLPNKHLIAATKSCEVDPECPAGGRPYDSFVWDIVNVHPWSPVRYRRQHYDMGKFMSGDLSLEPVRDFCLDTYHEPKPVNLDEDNVASRFRDLHGWTVHRKRAWTTLLSGGHYDFIDFSINIHTPTGTNESNRCIRTWFKHLSEFVHSLDLIRSRPLRNFLSDQPDNTVSSVMGVSGEEYVIYLADGREKGNPDLGSPLSGNIQVYLPENDYLVRSYSPTTGQYSSDTVHHFSGDASLELPTFEHDVVLRITAVKP